MKTLEDYFQTWLRVNDKVAKYIGVEPLNEEERARAKLIFLDGAKAVIHLIHRIQQSPVSVDAKLDALTTLYAEPEKVLRAMQAEFEARDPGSTEEILINLNESSDNDPDSNPDPDIQPFPANFPIPNLH